MPLFNANNTWEVKRIYWSNVLWAGSFMFGGYLWHLGGLAPMLPLVLATIHINKT